MITYKVKYTFAYVDSNTDILMGVFEFILVNARKYVRELRYFSFLSCTLWMGNRWSTSHIQPSLFIQLRLSFNIFIDEKFTKVY